VPRKNSSGNQIVRNTAGAQLDASRPGTTDRFLGTPMRQASAWPRHAE
jgi:hypothetical protein